MDASNILLWFVGLTCIWTLVNALRSRGASGTWTYPAGALLALTVAGYFLAPTWSGYVALGLWALFILLPARGFAWRNRLVDKGEYARALRLNRWLRLLHPFGDWRTANEQLQAWDLARQGRPAEGAALLRQRPAPQTSTGWAQAVQSFQLRGDWEGARTWIESFFSDDVVRRNPDILQFYLRALGETGDLEGLLRLFRQYRPLIDSAPWSGQVYLITLAFCGRRDTVARLAESLGPSYPPAIRDLWLATADLAAGNDAAGRAELERLQGDSRVGVSVRRRSAVDLARAEALSAEARAILDQLAAQAEREAAYVRPAQPKRWATYATYALIAANLIAFAGELYLGLEQDPLWVLYDMGGMVPVLVLAGEWWRLLAPMFLHVSLIHLVMNMFGLYMLGRAVESRLGWWRYTVLYLLSGFGAGLIVLGLTVVGALPDKVIYVGASGCIMGLVGAEGAIALRFWRRGRSPQASQQLGAVAFIVVAQIIFSLSTPGVSLAAHLGGLVVGFLCAMLFRFPAPARARSG
jgi:rhomboid protease GluP